MKPLSEKSRPKSFDDFYGQTHLVSPHASFRKLVEKDLFTSLILWGPPGTGKTTLAHIVSQVTQRSFITISAVTTGAKELKEIIDRGSNQAGFLTMHKEITLFVDELHRLNKAQQDILLGPLEKGQIKFIGATTENPSFAINNAILSRSVVFQVKSHNEKDLMLILEKVLKEQDEKIQKKIKKEFLPLISQKASGDARKALNMLELLILKVQEGCDELLEESIDDTLGDHPLKFDRNQDYRYGLISALIKSIRASHPDASVYYLARLIECGEDPMYLARRLIILASEDIGNANPHALNFANAAAQSVHMIGLPEARIILSQITLFLASSPKSKASYNAIEKATEDVKRWQDLDIPKHLVNAPTKLMKDFGYGKYYKDPHTNLSSARQQEYLPEKLKNKRYYNPSDHGYEKTIKNFLTQTKPLGSSPH